MKFFKKRVRYYADESYKKVYEAMKKDNVLRQDDIDYIDNKNIKNKKYNGNDRKEQSDFVYEVLADIYTTIKN